MVRHEHEDDVDHDTKCQQTPVEIRLTWSTKGIIEPNLDHHELSEYGGF